MKEIIIGLGLIWSIGSTIVLLKEVCNLWQEVKYLEDIVEDWDKFN